MKAKLVKESLNESLSDREVEDMLAAAVVILKEKGLDVIGPMYNEDTHEMQINDPMNVRILTRMDSYSADLGGVNTPVEPMGWIVVDDKYGDVENYGEDFEGALESYEQLLNVPE